MNEKFNMVKFPHFNSFEMSIKYCNRKFINTEDEPPSHIHELCEIYFNLSGKVSFMIENNTYPISRGNIIITRPYEYHHCIYHDNKEHEHYCLQFSGNENENILKMFFEREKGQNNHIILTNELTNNIVSHFEALMNADESSSLSNYYHFLRILNIIQNNISVPSPENAEDIPKALRNSLDIISKRFAEPITVKSISDEVFISENTLRRYFNRYLNISPKEYIKRKRISEAMLMLNNNVSISQVASHCGFSDTSGFIQIFKRYVGQTPYQYVKNKKL